MIKSAGRGEAKAIEPDLSELRRLVEENATPDRVANKIAKLLRVQRTEVALLRIENNILKFLHPPELRVAGAIPLSSNAVAARTAVTRTSLLSNNFLQVKHVNLFETVRLAADNSGTEFIETAPIQKLISVPIESEDHRKILGVIQISRKALDVRFAGPDFTSNDLKMLEQIVPILAQMTFMSSARTIASTS